MIKCRLRSQTSAKLFSHRDPQVDREFANVYRALARVDMGNFSWNYDKENKRLVLQVLDEDTGQQTVVGVFEEEGDIWAEGSFFNNYSTSNTEGTY